MDEIKQIVYKSTYANINRMIDNSINETFNETFNEYSAEYNPKVIKVTVDSASCTDVITDDDYRAYIKILDNIRLCRKMKEYNTDINSKRDFIENLKFWR